jgi:WD40 repeat protein
VVEGSKPSYPLEAIRLLDAFTGREIVRVGFPERIRGAVRIGQQLQWSLSFATFSFSPDGRRLAYCQDSTLYQWDASTGRQLTTNRIDDVPLLQSAVYVDDGRKIVCFCDTTAQVEWEASTGTLLATRRRKLPARPLAISPDARRLALPSRNRILISDAATGQVTLELRGHTKDVRIAAFSPDGRLLVSGTDDEVRVWNTEEVVDHAVTRLRAGSSVSSLAFHPDGRQIVVGDYAKEVEIWDLHSRKKTTLSGHPTPIVNVVVSRDGRTLISGSLDGTIHRWTLGELQASRTMRSKMPLRHLALDPRHLYVVEGVGSADVLVWNSSTGRLVRRLREADSPVTEVAVSPDGNQVAAGTESGVLMIWNTTTWELAPRIKAHSAGISAAGFSSDGRTIATAERNGEIRLWDARTGGAIAVLVGHESEVSTIAFSPDGRRLISGSSDATVRIWDAIHHDLLLTLQHDGPVTSVAWSPDGARIAASAGSGTVLVWSSHRPGT